MKQGTGWGAAVVIAIAAAVGISSQSTIKPPGSSPVRQSQSKVTKSATIPKRVHTECSELITLFQAFLLPENVVGPQFCYDTPPGSKSVISQPRFIIATLPDPLHTHFSLLFDRFVEAIQEGAQDEGYEYDSSWLPWETEEPQLTHLADQDEADDRKKNREDQPGVLLFHAAPDQGQPARLPYQQGLFVFIVGEDPTDGIHRKQFENTLQWITALQGDTSNRGSIAILGPTFSGSFPSMAQLLQKNAAHQVSRGSSRASGQQLAIYSGSATSSGAVAWFSNRDELRDLGISFHSLLQDDDTALRRFCRYLGDPTLDGEKKQAEEKGKANGELAFDIHRLAILSEDETAYGYSDMQTDPCKEATWLYYPRDISTLRAAYQKQSIFNSGSAQQIQGTTPRSSLPTDLADPEGKEHDTVRTYAGDQTPLSQEAQLVGIAEALRSHRAQYVVLRSSNTLDPLFLGNFLRREYPEARVVILNSDLLFQRGQDALALTGVMTLSTYPLFPWEREWTARASAPTHSHRVFPENSTEGTYIASRLLLHSPGLDRDPVTPGCTLSEDVQNADAQRAEAQRTHKKDVPPLTEPFLPSILCPPVENESERSYVPIPDYAPPSWTGECSSSMACKPATWLSVITRGRSWPLAALNEQSLQRTAAPSAWRVLRGLLTSSSAVLSEPPPTPLSMKLFLISLCGLTLFHAWCCRFASFTAKPAFRAHFATHDWRHRVLILLGSFLLALMALLSGWGCGIFAWTSGPPTDTTAVRYLVLLVWGVAGLSLITNIFITRKLNEDAANRRRGSRNDSRFRLGVILSSLVFCLMITLAFRVWVYPLEAKLMVANRVLVYWRSMNLASGVSPIVPFLSLTLGLYILFRYSLHGMALFGPDRPRLPLRVDLKITLKDVPNKSNDEKLDVLPMFCQECAGDPTEKVAKPFAWLTLALSLALFFVFRKMVTSVVGEMPIRSLGATTYSGIFCLWLDFCFSLILGAALQLLFTWGHLRQLLVFLDRLALRRTLGALRGFSWGTVWKMSGNVLDVRYKLLSRQLESLNHLHTSLQDLLNSDPDLDNDEVRAVENCLKSVDASRQSGLKFAMWYSENYRKSSAAGLRDFEDFQKTIAATTGKVLTDLLVPEWKQEKHSLILVQPMGSDEDEHKQSPPESTREHIRNAEELTCLTYLGFAQNILGRIRTVALGGLFLFVATTVAISSYPFDPRPALSGVMLLLFVTFGAVIVYVYADMHRDATLSHITNTTPGELGSEFWFKIAGFGAAPLIGLIATIFPDLSGFLFSWLQPGIASLK
jgi:hypothetical protein